MKAIKAMARNPGEPYDKFKDFAYTGQYVFGEIFMDLINAVQSFSPSKNLAISGGCALNSSFMGTALQRSNFDNIYVPSAPADNGKRHRRCLPGVSGRSSKLEARGDHSIALYRLCHQAKRHRQAQAVQSPENHRVWRRRLPKDRPIAGRRQNHRLVPGPRRIWPPFFGQPLYSGQPMPGGHQGHRQRTYQIP